MNQNINIDEVKQYNASLKQYKEKAAQLNAEIEYTNKEIDELCTELSSELGITVTKDNIEQIYEEQVNKINMALQSGKAVLAKIATEENNQITNQNVANVDQTPIATPTQTVIDPVSAPVESMQIPNSAPVAGSVFNTQAPSAPLPPMFNV